MCIVMFMYIVIVIIIIIIISVIIIIIVIIMIVRIIISCISIRIIIVIICLRGVKFPKIGEVAGFLDPEFLTPWIIATRSRRTYVCVYIYIYI